MQSSRKLVPHAVIFLSVYSYYTYYNTITMIWFIIMKAAEIRSCACTGCWCIAHSLILFKGLDQLKPYPNTLSLKASYGFNASKIHPGTINLTNWKERGGWDFWWHLGLVTCTLSRGEPGAQKVPSSQAGSSQAHGQGVAPWPYPMERDGAMGTWVWEHIPCWKRWDRGGFMVP